MLCVCWLAPSQLLSSVPKHVSRKDCKIIGEGKKEESEGVAKEKEGPIASIGANMNRGRFPVKMAWFLYLYLSL